MVTTRVASRRVWSGINNLVDIIDPQAMTPGVIGKGALRGLRVQNLAHSGWYRSGFIQMRLTIDSVVVASGQLQIPYIDGQRPGRGTYINLGQWVLGADYHENPQFNGSGASCDCAMLVNQQRLPYTRSLRLQAGWTYSGTSRLSGFTVDAWFEIKGR